jgi:hypothetical protein
MKMSGRKRTLHSALIGFALLLACALNQHAQAKQPSGERPQAEGWKTYNWGKLSFRYPPSWQVEPQHYRTPPEEEAGKPGSVIGLRISPTNEPRLENRSIWFGGLQADCAALTSCKCFTIYETEYTCNPDPETSRIFDQILTTIRYDDPDYAFQIIAPSTREYTRSNANFTIRWKTRPGLHISRVSLGIHDTASGSGRDSLVLQAKDIPNSGEFEWFVPANLRSSGPYIIEIFYLKPIKAEPPALSASHIFAGRSDPFYVR